LAHFFLAIALLVLDGTLLIIFKWLTEAVFSVYFAALHFDIELPELLLRLIQLGTHGVDVLIREGALDLTNLCEVLPDDFVCELA
jgi:hypothetical protein